MPIPKYNDIWEPALRKIGGASEAMRARDLEPILAQFFKLSEGERTATYESGNSGHPIFFHRMSWAISSLYQLGLITKPRRGENLISEKGVSVLASESNIKEYIKEGQAELRRLRRQKASNDDKPARDEIDSNERAPMDSLFNASKKLQQAAYDEILDTLISKSPRLFEHVVVELLQKLGYGGGLPDAGRVTQSTNDHGIDGEIKEDILGLGWIYIQAKRYARDNTVGREYIHKFMGALTATKSNKGVFITTSSFSKGAKEYAENLTGTAQIVLIDGGLLARHVYSTGLGMKVDNEIKIKSLDADFWDAAD